MWTQHWPITERRGKERDAGKILAENGGKHPFGLTSLMYLLREVGVNSRVKRLQETTPLETARSGRMFRKVVEKGPYLA